jgi:signal transduction histidine kinase/CheY-like chemotaxis protein
MDNQPVSLNSKQIQEELTISATPVLTTLTAVALVLLLFTGKMTDIVNSSFLLTTRLALYAIILLGWLINFQSPKLAKWMLAISLPVFIFKTALAGSMPDVLILAFLPVGISAMMLGPLAGVASAGVFSVCFVALEMNGGGLFNAREIIFSLGAVWSMAVVMAGLYRPLYGVGNWVLNFYNQAVYIRKESDQLRVELNQALEDVIHSNWQLTLANEKQLSFRIMAEEAQKTKAAFVAKVSHEFRTPLNMIIGLVNLMVDNPQIYGRSLPKAMVNDLEIVQRNCEHLTSMINDVLALSQAESGKVVLNREYVDLREIIEQAFEVVSPLVKKKNLETRYTAPASLSLVSCDRTRIRQVLLNLVSNSARFTEQGGIYVDVVDHANDVQVCVHDTGPGISTEDAERIFDPFCQGGANQPYRDKGGTGLGLTISKQFIELHGGKIWVESEPGKGAAFYFTLPKEFNFGPTAAPSRWIDDRWNWISRGGKMHFKPEATPALRMAVLDGQNALDDYLQSYKERLSYFVSPDVEHLLQELKDSPVNLVLVNAASVDELTGLVETVRQEVLDTPLVGSVYKKPSIVVAGDHVEKILVKPITKNDMSQALSALSHSPRKILLVDNDAEIIDLYSRMLLAIDPAYLVSSATRGDEALELMEGLQPELVMLDLAMPGKDGFTLLAEKRQRSDIRDIPVMIISAMDMRENAFESPLMLATMADGLGLSRLLNCAVGVSDLLLNPHVQLDPAP